MFAPNLPYTVQIELTSICNLTCKMCPLTEGRTLSSQSAGPMSQVIWERVLAVATHVKRAILVGFGEALLHPKVKDLLLRLEQAKVEVGLSTNCTTLSEERVRFLNQLSNLSHLNASIDSFDEDTYRRIRGRSFARTYAGLLNLARHFEMKDKITVSFVLMRDNYEVLDGLVERIKKLGFTHVRLQGLSEFNESSRAYRLSSSDGLRRLLAFEGTCKSEGITVSYCYEHMLKAELSDYVLSQDLFGIGEVKDTRICMIPWEIPFIDKEGRVFPCCHASSDSASVMGDLGTEDFESVWRGNRFMRFRERLMTGDALPKVCKNCRIMKKGVHPLREFDARIDFQNSRIAGNSLVRLAIKNIGCRVWTPQDLIRVGTSYSRDRKSQLWTSSWLCEDRVGELKRLIAPDETATLQFEVNPNIGPLDHPEVFQVVVDANLWIPGTEFAIERTPVGFNLTPFPKATDRKAAGE